MGLRSKGNPVCAWTMGIGLCFLMGTPVCAQSPVLPRVGGGDASGQKAEREPVPEMVFVKGGLYRTRPDDAKSIPATEIQVRDFWIGRYEVTFGEFDRFCRQTPYYTTRYHGAQRPFDHFRWKRWLTQIMGSVPVGLEEEYGPRPAILGKFPVANVCWLDAMAYCLWLSEQFGVSVRLPTQVEWEYACTAGNTDPSVDRLDERTSLAWYADNKKADMQGPQFRPVGQKKPNLWGLSDMLGNVWEWCLDGPTNPAYPDILAQWESITPTLKYMDMNRGSPYLESVSPLFKGPKGAAKALRGGAYEEPAERVSPSYRMFYRMNYMSTRVGFRIVTSVSPPWCTPTKDIQGRPLSATGTRSEPPARGQDRQGDGGLAQDLDQERRLVQAELSTLMARYQEIMGEKLSTYPILAWRDELMRLEQATSDMCAKKDVLRDQLSEEGRKQFFRLRTLYAWTHLLDYTGNEPEFVVAFQAMSTGIKSSTAKLSAGKKEAVQKELKELIERGDLSKAFVNQAEVEGTMEARVDLLEAAIRTQEPPEAVGLGHRIQTLRHRLRRMDDPTALVGSGLVDEIAENFLKQALDSFEPNGIGNR